MNSLSENEIIKVFNLLDENNIKYILLRNIDNELPSDLKKGKDIDLLIENSTENKNKLDSLLKKIGYNTIRHPHWNDDYVYSADKFVFKYNKKNNIILDLNFQVLCRSLNKGEWIPLHKTIQESLWQNKIKVKIKELICWMPCPEDEFICLLARAIFDKRKFSDKYKNRITKLYQSIDEQDIISKIELVFYKYTLPLLSQVKTNQYNGIITNYKKFHDY